MRELKKRDRLEITIETSNRENDRVEYKLYEDLYLSGMGYIFRAVMKQENLKQENAKGFYSSEERRVLPFIGKRGSGKTTAMNEFCRILESLEDDSIKTWWLENALEEEEREVFIASKFKFHILTPIDASLLSGKEDLFELILVNIYRYYEDDLTNDIVSGRRDELRARKCMAMIEKIFKTYRIIQKRKDDEVLGKSIVSMMEFMASSKEIQEQVSELIDELFLLRGDNKSYEFIVIAIDDLDLNLEYGYEMLEQIQKYFSHYKIIVLITMDYEQMTKVCEEHFRKAFWGNDNPEHDRMLANDFMTKMFPFSQRLFMPDMRKIAKRALAQERVKQEGQSIKAFVMQKIMRKMRIYYDACGLKDHFCEPATVRDFVSYNEFLNSLIPIEYENLVCVEKMKKGGENEKEQENNEMILRKYDQNHERFNWDIMVRLAQNTLTPMQKRAFDKLLNRDLERRAMYFVAEKRDRIQIQMESINQETYSYGAMLQKIYEWGREYFDDKPFISCILASFTSEMVREYLNYRYNVDEEKALRSKKRLLQFVGNSFGNQWVGDMFPKVNVMMNSRPARVRTGYAFKAEADYLDVEVNIGKLSELSADSSKAAIERCIKEWMDEEEIIATLEIIDMFTVKRSEDLNAFEGMEFVFSIGSPSEEDREPFAILNEKGKIVFKNPVFEGFDAIKPGKNKEVLKISGKGREINLDAMAFVAKSLNYDREKMRMENCVVDGLAKVVGNYMNISEKSAAWKNLRGAIRRQMREKSLFYRYISNGFEHEVAFPFYNLDLSYNVIKRVRSEFVNAGNIEPTEIFMSLLTVYERIEKRLKDEDTFYQEGSEKGNGYAEIFAKCPYIKAIRDCETKEIVQSRLVKAIRVMGDAEAGPRRIEKPDDTSI